MNGLKLNAKIFFYLLLGFNILLVGATLVVFTLASSTAQKKSNQISNLKADSQTNDELLNYYKVLQNTLNNNKGLQATLQAVLPSDKDQSAALTDLDKFSKSTNVTITQIGFNPGTNTTSGKTLTSPSSIKGVSIITVSLTCSSVRYEDLLAFLHDIETTQRRMQVATIDISPNATNPDLLDQVTLTINIYLKPGS